MTINDFNCYYLLDDSILKPLLQLYLISDSNKLNINFLINITESIKIQNNVEYCGILWDRSKIKASQIEFFLQENTRHFHQIRFFSKSLVIVNSDANNRVDYYIMISQQQGKNARNYLSENETHFFFGGNASSVKIFSNLLFKHIIELPFLLIRLTNEEYRQDYGSEILDYDELIETYNIDEVPIREVLFMHLYSDDKIIFLNCKFINSTKKKFVILTEDDSDAQFVNCEFEGDFIFKAAHNSVILN